MNEEKDVNAINEQVRSTLSTCIAYILKWAYRIEASAETFFGKIEEKKFSINPNFDENRKMLIRAFELYEKYYKKVLSQTNTFKKMKIQENSNSLFKLNISNEFIDFLKNMKLQSDEDNTTLSNLSTFYSQIKNFFIASKSQYSTEKFNNEMKTLLSNINNIEIKNIENAQIESVTGNIPKSIQNDGTLEQEKDNENVPDAKLNKAAKEAISLGDHLGDENFEEIVKKVKEDIKSSDDELEEWLNNHPEREELYDQFKKILGDEIISQAIPTLWTNHMLITVKEDYFKESISRKHLLRILTEEEQKTETNDLANKVKYLLDDSVEKLLKIQKTDEFKNEYTSWVKNINSIIEELLNRNDKNITNSLNKVKDLDPLDKAATCLTIMKKMKNTETATEEKPENNNDTNNETEQTGEQKANESFRKKFQKTLKTLFNT